MKELTKTTLFFLFGIAFTVGVMVVGTIAPAWAQNTNSILFSNRPAERTLTGYNLAYALNGTPKYVTFLEDDGGTSCNEVRLADGSNTMVQCDNATYISNDRCDGGIQSTGTIKVAADEKYPFGLLTPGMPYVSISAATASTKSTCKFFRPF